MTSCTGSTMSETNLKDKRCGMTRARAHAESADTQWVHSAACDQARIETSIRSGFTARQMEQLIICAEAGIDERFHEHEQFVECRFSELSKHFDHEMQKLSKQLL